MRYDPTPANAEPDSVAGQLRAMFLKGVVFPAAVLAFFLLAPAWLESRLHEQVYHALVREGRTADLARWSEVDFAEVCASTQPEHAALRKHLADTGVCQHFYLLSWARALAVLLMAVSLGSAGAALWLNQRAKRSRTDLIKSYRTAWRICLTAAVLQLVLLVPLLGYGLYELTTLAFDRYFPQLILGIVIGGLIALWRSGQILLTAPPLEFTEPLARAVSEGDAPDLWRAVRDAAGRLRTTPPDHIVVGLQMNFYVTELSVRVDDGVVHGRTLFLSYPLLKLLSPAEILAIIGHELGHFLGDDTRVTREFYPLRFKVNGTLYALAHAGWAGWTSIHGLGFFNWAFGGTEQAMSRERELIADRVAADLTSPATMAQALVKFQVMCEAFNLQLGTKGAFGNPLTSSLVPVIREQLVPKQQFWRDLFEMKTPHPLDSHPDLRTRLSALKEPMDEAKAIAIATAETGSAYEAWFGGRESVFAEFVAKANSAIEQTQRQQQIIEASYDTAEGREALEQHFPERRFSLGKRGARLVIGLILLCGVLAAGLTSLIEGDAGRIVPVLALGAGGGCIWWYRRWTRGTELILRADRIMYTGWNRPLHWADVAQLTAVNINGGLRAVFTLKQKAPPFARRALIQSQRQTVQLSLHPYAIKQQELLQVINRYYTRQMEPPANGDTGTTGN